MPFKSGKQRRYLYAKHPDVARKFEADTGMGGLKKMASRSKRRRRRMGSSGY